MAAAVWHCTTGTQAFSAQRVPVAAGGGRGGGGGGWDCIRREACRPVWRNNDDAIYLLLVDCYLH